MDAKITVKSRELKGSANARRLRREGWVPGVIYSDGTAARPVALPQHDFEQMLRRHASEHVMIKIQVDGGKEEAVLLKDIQHNALSGSVVHVDLQKVALDKKLRLEVPVELDGEAEGVKNQGGVLDHLLHHVEIECFPADIPEMIRVDVSALKIGDVLLVKDLPASASYTVVTDGELGLALVAQPKVAEEPAAAEGAAAAAAGPEVIREKKKEEAE